METVTLKGEDFRTVHNTLCELRGLVQRMTQSMIKIDDVQRIIEGFDQGLADAYRQEDDVFHRKMDHYDSVREQLGLRSRWSMFEVADLYDTHPYPADSFVVYDQHWGTGRKHFPVMGPLWLDVFRAADRAISESGDNHHVFIEGFQVKNRNELHMTTGS